MAQAEGPRLMLSRDSHCDELTKDECAALTASARGLISHEVAESLGVSPETARNLIAAAVQKLGARSKLEAVVLALRSGRIRLSP